jgi:hypothetical protein
MTWWVGALVAVLGALAAELAEVDLVRRRTGRLPWNRHKLSKVDGQTFAPMRVYLVGVPIRLAVAGIIGGVYASADQISGAIGALTLGAGASLFVSRLSEQKDLGDLPHPSELPLTLGTSRLSTLSITLPGREETAHEAERG